MESATKERHTREKGENTGASGNEEKGLPKKSPYWTGEGSESYSEGGERILQVLTGPWQVSSGRRQERGTGESCGRAGGLLL